jgi:hypothetical protein
MTQAEKIEAKIKKLKQAAAEARKAEEAGRAKKALVLVRELADDRSIPAEWRQKIEAVLA